MHELLNLYSECDNVLAKGSVLTVEPGTYIPKWGGVRIEGRGIVREEGYKNLIGATYELIEL